MSSGYEGKSFTPTEKKARLYNSRQIRSQINDSSFTNPPKGKNSEQKLINSQIIPNKLSIPHFMEAREFEIRALESAMIKSKTGGSSRVFQSLPRSLRRRTASHNVKRIPKRMRRKALKEMGITNNGISGTKGVKSSGVPITKKQRRGRERYKLIKKLKLLKWAAKWKTEGQLPSGDWISYTGIKMSEKLNLLRKQLKQLKNERDLKLELLNQDSKFNSIVTNEKKLVFNLMKNLKNHTGAYDNTSVNEHAKIHKVTSLKYATRQRLFKWLPTHVWHAKRSKMIKRWEWSLPYTPTQKCYRKTSRSSRINGSLAQDTSFTGTIIINCHSNDTSKSNLINFISKLTKNLANKNRYMSGKNIWNGYLYNDSDFNPIGKGSIIWALNDASSTLSKIILRLHPANHSTIFTYLLNEFANDQNISIHDCKYSIGSISITGPKSITSLQSILHRRYSDTDNDNKQFNTFMSLLKLHDINTIPDGTILSFDVADPRFWTKPVLPTRQKLQDDDIIDLIISMKQFKITSESSKLVDINERNNSYVNQLSHKLLARRRQLHPGEAIPLETKDSSIPIILYKVENVWTMMLPWFWVMPFWFSLIHVPHVQLGCLKQFEQLQFEKGELGWSDMVFTNDGYIESEFEKDVEKERWEKRPKSKRVNFDKLKISDNEIGETLSPFGLDWRGLQALRYAVKRIKISNVKWNGGKRKLTKDDKLNYVPEILEDIGPIVKAIRSAEDQMKDNKKHEILAEKRPIELSSELCNMSEEEILKLKFNILNLPPLKICAISFKCKSTGNVKPNGRIYKIPDNQISKLNVKSDARITEILNKKIKPEVVIDVPHIEHLVGLVSSGSFNLVEGCYTGVGFIDASEIEVDSLSGKFFVRNVASTACYVIDWKKL